MSEYCGINARQAALNFMSQDPGICAIALNYSIFYNMQQRY